MLGGLVKKNKKRGLEIFFCALFFVLFFQVAPAKAIGLSPPKIELGLIENNEAHLLSMNIIRGVGEVGDLYIAVEKREGNAILIQGADSLRILANQNLVTYYFVVSPSDAATGDYELKIDFFSESEAADDPDGAVGVSIRAGITGVITYSIVSDVEPVIEEDDDGGGGGSSFHHPEDEDEEIAEEPPVTEEDSTADEEPVAEEPETEPEVNSDQSVPETEEEPTETEVIQIIGDLTEDEQVDWQDVTIFFEGYGTNFGLADFDHNGTVNARDLSILVFNLTTHKKVPQDTPPFTAGPPHNEDKVVFHFQMAEDDTQKFDVVLASSVGANDQQNDYLTFYLLVDTGLSGINTADLEIQYDTEKLKFVQSNLSGSYFDIFPQLPYEISPGRLSFLGASTESFVGTNGFLAAFDFLPVTGGETSLDFSKVLAFKNQGETPDSVTAIGINGLVKKSGEISPQETQEISSTESETAERQKIGIFGKYSFLIWLFVIILILDILAIIVWRRHYKKNKI